MNTLTKIAIGFGIVILIIFFLKIIHPYIKPSPPSPPSPSLYWCNRLTGTCDISQYGTIADKDECDKNCTKYVGKYKCVDNVCREADDSDDPQAIYKDESECLSHCSPVLPAKIFEDSQEDIDSMNDVVKKNCSYPDGTELKLSNNDASYVNYLQSKYPYVQDNKALSDKFDLNETARKRYFIVENKCPINVNMGYIGYKSSIHSADDPSTYNMFDVSYLHKNDGTVNEFNDDSRVGFGGFSLRSGEAALLSADDPIVSGRIWPRTRCSYMDISNGDYCFYDDAVKGVQFAIDNAKNPPPPPPVGPLPTDKLKCQYVTPDFSYKYSYKKDSDDIENPASMTMSDKTCKVPMCLPCPGDGTVTVNSFTLNPIDGLSYFEFDSYTDCNNNSNVTSIDSMKSLAKYTSVTPTLKENMTCNQNPVTPNVNVCDDNIKCSDTGILPSVYTSNISIGTQPDLPIDTVEQNKCHNVKIGCKTGDVRLPCGSNGVCGYAGCIARGYCDPYKYPPRGGLGPMGTTGLSPGLTIEYTLSAGDYVGRKVGPNDYYDVSQVDGYSKIPLSMNPIEGRYVAIDNPDLSNDFNSKPAICGKLCEDDCPHELRAYDGSDFIGCVSICHAVTEKDHRTEFKNRCLKRKQEIGEDQMKAEGWSDCCYLDNLFEATIYWDEDCDVDRKASDNSPWFGKWLDGKTRPKGYESPAGYEGVIPDETFKTKGCWRISDGTRSNDPKCGTKTLVEDSKTNAYEWSADDINKDYQRLFDMRTDKSNYNQLPCKFLTDLLCCDVGQFSIAKIDKDCLDPYPNSDNPWTYTDPDKNNVATNASQFGCSPYNEKYGLTKDREDYYKQRICWASDWPKPNAWCDAKGITDTDKCSYSNLFKENCPNAYSWQFDDLNSTYMTQQADYYITLCPDLAP